MTVSGISHIALLWFTDITGNSLIEALYGAFYLFIGIGLYGNSRFALVMAIIVPAVGTRLGIEHAPELSLGLTHTLWLITDIAVILLSFAVLWRVRHTPSQ